MDLADVALFQKIAQSGSLSAAGRQLNLAPMAVSRKLANLEQEVGARLFNRTTRSLSLTPEGEAFLPYAAELLETRNAALSTVASGDAGLTGTLKVTAPNVIGRSIVMPTLSRMIADNPGLRVDLTLSDGIVDVVGSGLDVAIRVSPLETSELVATKLAENPRVLCASPDYIARFGQPTSVENLVSFPCLTLHGIDTWPFRVSEELKLVPVRGPLVASSVDALRSACLSGVGLALLTYWDVWQSLERGELTPISLSDAEPDELGIWAVFPSRRYLPKRVKALIETLRSNLGQMASKFSDGAKSS